MVSLNYWGVLMDNKETLMCHRNPEGPVNREIRMDGEDLLLLMGRL